MFTKFGNRWAYIAFSSGIAEVEAFCRQYLRTRIFGLPRYIILIALDNHGASPPKTSALSLSHILDSDTSTGPLKREKTDSLTPVGSDEEEQKRMTASCLLNLASPEAVPCEEPTYPRKRARSRYYADTMSRPFAENVRPAYEFMSESATIRYTCNIPQSPPQSPPKITKRIRARPYFPSTDNDLF